MGLFKKNVERTTSNESNISKSSADSTSSVCEKQECVFCKIVKKKTGKIIYEDKDTLAFYDIRPQAPVHFVVMPKKHIDMVQNATEKDAKLFGKMMYTAKTIANEIPELKNGYRLVMNNGENGRQEIYHVHLHVVGGAKLIKPRYVKHASKKTKSEASISS